jgi:hypothetical protein
MAKYWQLNILIWGQGDIFRKGAPIFKKSKKYFFNKTYQVDTSRKGKIEKNTIEILSDRFELTTKSYWENVQKTH